MLISQYIHCVVIVQSKPGTCIDKIVTTKSVNAIYQTEYNIFPNIRLQTQFFLQRLLE